jgi:hypothetical protein
MLLFGQRFSPSALGGLTEPHKGTVSSDDTATHKTAFEGGGPHHLVRDVTRRSSPRWSLTRETACGTAG